MKRARQIEPRGLIFKSTIFPTRICWFWLNEKFNHKSWKKLFKIIDSFVIIGSTLNGATKATINRLNWDYRFEQLGPRQYNIISCNKFAGYGNAINLSSKIFIYNTQHRSHKHTFWVKISDWPRKEKKRLMNIGEWYVRWSAVIAPSRQ